MAVSVILTKYDSPVPTTDERGKISGHFVNSTLMHESFPRFL